MKDPIRTVDHVERIEPRAARMQRMAETEPLPPRDTSLLSFLPPTADGRRRRPRRSPTGFAYWTLGLIEGLRGACIEVALREGSDGRAFAQLKVIDPNGATTTVLVGLGQLTMAARAIERARAALAAHHAAHPLPEPK